MVNSFERLLQVKAIFKYGTAENQFSNLNSDLILKNIIKYKLQNRDEIIIFTKNFFFFTNNS